MRICGDIFVFVTPQTTWNEWPYKVHKYIISVFLASKLAIIAEIEKSAVAMATSSRWIFDVTFFFNLLSKPPSHHAIKNFWPWASMITIYLEPHFKNWGKPTFSAISEKKNTGFRKKMKIFTLKGMGVQLDPWFRFSRLPLIYVKLFTNVLFYFLFLFVFFFFVFCNCLNKISDTHLFNDKK